MNAPAVDPWDDPDAARLYEAFYERHDRYRVANQTLVAEAALAPGHRVLDVGAGTGRTAEAALPHLGEAGRVTCFEPAAAMRSVGSARLRDVRVGWTDTLPELPARFDRVLCGASIWVMVPIPAALARLAALVAPGGALAFDLPTLYLGVPDEPGGGPDPWLHELPARLASVAPPVPQPVATPHPPPDAAGVENALREAGLRPERWTFRERLTLSAYRDWLKIPATGALPGLPAHERVRRIDEVAAGLDPASWRWESWTGWTAWRR